MIFDFSICKKGVWAVVGTPSRTSFKTKKMLNRNPLFSNVLHNTKFCFMFSKSRVPMPATGAACVGTPVLELAEPGSGTLSMLGTGDAAWPGCSALIRAGDAAWPGCSALLGAGGAAWLGLAEPGPPASASKRCCSAASRILQSARTSLSSRHVFVPCLRVATPREAAYFMSSGFRISSTLPPIAPGSRRWKDRLPTQTWPRRRR